MTGGCPEPSGAARRTLSLKDATWREAEVALDTQQLSADHKTGAVPESWRCRPQGADGALERREDQRAWGRPGPSVTLTRAFGGHSRRKTQPCLVAWGQGLPDTACWGQPSGARSLLAPAGKETLGHRLPGPRTGAGRKARLPGRRLILTSETLTFDRNWFHRETAAAAPGPDWTSLQRDFGCTCPACRWWAAVLAS